MGDRIHFVFDLDDTLYPEKTYVRSALSFVAQGIASQFGETDAFARLMAMSEAGEKNPIGALWDEFGWPEAPASVARHRPCGHA